MGFLTYTAFKYYYLSIITPHSMALWMGTPFKIPKKKQPSDSSSLHMMSPLSRVQDSDTSKTSWSQVALNGKRQAKSSSFNGRTDASPGSAGADRSVPQSPQRSEVRGPVRVNGTPAKGFGTPNSRTTATDRASPTDQNRWRPKRASDTLCQRERDQDTPAIKKPWGSTFTASWKSSQMEAEEDEDEAVAPVEEANGPSSAAVSQQSSVRSLRSNATESKTVGVKGNGEKARPSSDQTPKEEVAEKRVRSSGEKDAFSVFVRKPLNDYSRKTLRLRLSYKTSQRAKPSSTEPKTGVALPSPETTGGELRDGVQNFLAIPCSIKPAKPGSPGLESP
ncbi:hypothetical protein NFI96_027284 [Prochilodus magdalenae]|nr:hypothetical protein NFI96_027284 [Prochilodus magdalenae]